MNEQIEQIIRELLEIDPSLRGQEALMKKTIEKLLGERPDTGFDEVYQAELKAELLKQFSKKEAFKKPLKKVYWGLAATLIVGVVALSLWFATGKDPGFSLLPVQENASATVGEREPVPAEELDKPVKENRDPASLEPPPPLETKRSDSNRKMSGEKSAVEDERTPVEKKAQEAPTGSIRDKLNRTAKAEETTGKGVEGGVVGGVLDMAFHSEPISETLEKKAFVPRRNEEKRVEVDRFNTEGYATVRENDFLPAIDNPLSTFSIDVDTASYANIRRFLNQNRLPPMDAVRIEELINYFDYDYKLPEGEVPFAVHREICAAPWEPEHKLVMVALQGRDLVKEKLPPSNLVFLLDVSGSMDEPNKLPLLKESFKMLVRQLGNKDRVAIVVYAGAAGLVLPSTSAGDKDAIIAALDRLQAGGSTAGGAGIQLAYQVAMENYIKGGNNRVILATDGDFNIGASSDAEMERLIEEKRRHGVFLSVLGFGMGNYKDAKMEILADKGNGNYAYIDSLIEAQKVLTHDIRKTLFTIAKDVKIQLEFNPARVGSYRLIGYENRLLKKEDFRDDQKDAGEIGAGHSVTVFYEIIPADAEQKNGESLKYQDTRLKDSARDSRELLTVRVRYKEPDGEQAMEISETLLDQVHKISAVSKEMQFASAVAEFGMLLRDSRYKGRASFEKLIERARSSLGRDLHGYRHEFVRLAEIASILVSNRR